MSDERGTAERPELRFPSVEEIARINRLFSLIERQRRDHDTPHTEPTRVDREALLALRFTPEEIDEAARDTAM